MNKQIFKNRWFVWAIAVIVIVGFGVWGFIECSVIKMANEESTEVTLHRSPSSMQNSSEVEGWQTYRNEEYGFEIVYPKDWHLTFEDPVVEFATVLKKDYAHGLGSPGSGEAWVTIIQRTSVGLDREEDVQIYKDIYQREKIIFKEHNGKIFETRLGFWKDDSKENNYKDIFNQIISTFKFIEPQSYTVCGCGCCGGMEPKTECLYHSKGDDIQKIIEEDKAAAKSADCKLMGCSKGIKYSYCD